MAKPLTDQILDVVLARWKQGERAIASETVYHDLVQRGVLLSEVTMADAFEALWNRRLLHGARPMTSEAGKRPGSVVVTWVNPALLQNSDPI